MHRRQLQFGLPLQVLVELDSALMSGGPAGNRVRIRRLEVLRPLLPGFDAAVLLVEMGLQGFEQREAVKRVTAIDLEFPKATNASRLVICLLLLKLLVTQFEHFELG